MGYSLDSFKYCQISIPVMYLELYFLLFVAHVHYIGDAMKKLEERGIIIRFVIGRRFHKTFAYLFSFNFIMAYYSYDKYVIFQFILICMLF